MPEVFKKGFDNAKDLTVADFKIECTNILKKLDKLSDSESYLKDVSDKELITDLELTFLELFLQSCYAEERAGQLPSCLRRSNKGDVDPDEFPCRVYQSEEYKALLIDTPVVLGSFRKATNIKQPYMVKNLVQVALLRYEEKQRRGLSWFIRSPFSFCLYRRCLPNLSSTVVPDCDNVEAQKIINTLVRDLSLMDAYSSMVSCTGSIEYVGDKAKTGTSILLVQEDKRLAMESRFIDSGRSFDFLRNSK